MKTTIITKFTYKVREYLADSVKYLFVKEEWLSFIKTYDTGEFINVGEFRTIVDGEYFRENDPYVTPFPYIKQLYDINGTPKVYVLDKDKKILVNAIKGNIGVEQIDGLIRRESAKY